jgi:hypothetical protein
MSAPITEAHRKLRETLEIRWMRATELEIEQLIADSEARACAAVAQWHPASVSPQPSFEGVLCEAYLAITLDAERPCVLTYIYANRQWTQGEGDTQRIKCWGRITPRDWTAERDQLRAETDRLTAQRENLLKPMRDQAIARAERAEACLHALRLVCGATDADKFTTWVHRAIARAERAEAELLIAQRLLIDSEDAGTVAENLRAELATERARLDWLTMNAHVDLEEYREGSRSEGGTPWYCWKFSSPRHSGDHVVNAIDAAMKEDTK